MKQKDFWQKLGDNGKVADPEWKKFVESLGDGDIPDKIFELHENAYLTPDRAKAHPEVHGKLRSELLDPVDNDIAKLMDALKEHADPAQLNVLKNEQNTYKKMGFLQSVVSETIKKVKATPSTDEDTKKKLKTQEATIAELMGKIETINTEYTQKASDLEKNFQTQLSDYRLNSELEKMAGSYTLAEQFEKTRPAITKVLLTDLKSKHSLALGEKDGQAFIRVNDEKGQPKFNGNSAVTINQLLDEAFKDFTKKSNADDGVPNPGNPSPPRQGDTGQRFHVDQNQTQIRQGSRTTVQ